MPSGSGQDGVYSKDSNERKSSSSLPRFGPEGDQEADGSTDPGSAAAWLQSGSNDTGAVSGKTVAAQEKGIRENLGRFGDPKEASFDAKFIPEKSGGNEHNVVYDNFSNTVRKRLKTENYWGRPDWNPSDYLKSISLFNQIAPSARIDIIGAYLLDDGTPSLVIEMPAIMGKHLSPKEVHKKLENMGFTRLNDGSTTLDYVHPAGIIIRDAHHKNFVYTEKGDLIPIDLQVERK